jgi:hypothetical protein
VDQTSDQTVVNSAVLVDSRLSFPMGAGQRVRFRGAAYFETTAAADFKWRHAGPSPTLVRIHRRWRIPAGTAYAGITSDTTWSAADLALAGTGAGAGEVWLEGVVQSASTGTFVFRFAQNTATNDTGAVLRAGSYLEYRV